MFLGRNFLLLKIFLVVLSHKLYNIHIYLLDSQNEVYILLRFSILGNTRDEIESKQYKIFNNFLI